MKPEYRDLYRRDQERLAGWPPRFRGEGPFLPTGRRKNARLLVPSLVAVGLAIVSAAGLQWRYEPFDASNKRGTTDARPEQVPAKPVMAAGDDRGSPAERK